jgi:hypothetical protein
MNQIHIASIDEYCYNVVAFRKIDTNAIKSNALACGFAIHELETLDAIIASGVTNTAPDNLAVLLEHAAFSGCFQMHP